MNKLLPMSVLCMSLSVAMTASAETLSERWWGLSGTILFEDQYVTLPTMLWRFTAPPSKTNPPPTNAPSKPAAEGELHLMAQGSGYVRGGSGPGRATRMKGPFDGLFLGYSLDPKVSLLTLRKEHGRDTAWKRVELQFKSSNRKLGYSGNQSETSRTGRCYLEAAHRPGWYLAIDTNGRMCLSDGTPPRQEISWSSTYFHDDLKDGK